MKKTFLASLNMLYDVRTFSLKYFCVFFSIFSVTALATTITYVKGLDNQEYEISFDETTTIADVKKQLQEKFSLEISEEDRFIFAGKSLKDSDNIYLNNIRKDDHIHFLSRSFIGGKCESDKLKNMDFSRRNIFEDMDEVKVIKPKNIFSKKILQSYQYFNSFYTKKSLQSMQLNGKGMFFIHGIEPFSAYKKQWDLPTDIPKDFVELYPEQMLNKRLVIAGSVVAFNGQPKTTLSETFSACGYIISFEKENLFMAASGDFGSPVDIIGYHISTSKKSDETLWLSEFSNLRAIKESYPDRQQTYMDSHQPYSLGDLIHYPLVYDNFGKDGRWYHRNAMNEVAIYSSVKDRSSHKKSYLIPKIEGVFINERRILFDCCNSDYNPQENFDYDDIYKRTLRFVEPMKEWAKRHNLPIIEFTHTRKDTDYLVEQTCSLHDKTSSQKEWATSMPCEHCHGVKQGNRELTEDELRSYGVLEEKIPLKKDIFSTGDKFFDKGLQSAKDYIDFYTLEMNYSEHAIVVKNKISKKIIRTIKNMLKDFRGKHSRSLNEPNGALVFDQLQEIESGIENLKYSGALAPYHIESTGIKLAYFEAMLLNPLTPPSDHGNMINFAQMLDVLKPEKAFEDREKSSNIPFKKIIPLYSRNGSIGFNTFCYALTRGFFPVGFSNNPYPVHGNLFHGSKLAIIDHDYRHCSSRSRRLFQASPTSFSQYKQIYERLMLSESLLADKQIELKKNIFILFFMLNEIGFNLETKDIKKRDFISRVKRHISTKFDATDESLSPEIIKGIIIAMISESLDFIPLLREFGFDIRSNGSINSPTEAIELNTEIRNALISLWETTVVFE